MIKPGLTGWAQVRYTYGATVEEAMENSSTTLLHQAPVGDVRSFIIFETIKTVLLRGELMADSADGRHHQRDDRRRSNTTFTSACSTA